MVCTYVSDCIYFIFQKFDFIASHAHLVWKGRPFAEGSAAVWRGRPFTEGSAAVWRGRPFTEGSAAVWRGRPFTEGSAAVWRGRPFTEGSAAQCMYCVLILGESTILVSVPD